MLKEAQFHKDLKDQLCLSFEEMERIWTFFSPDYSLTIYRSDPVAVNLLQFSDP